MAQFGGAKNPPWARAGAEYSMAAGLGQAPAGILNQTLNQTGVASVYTLTQTAPSVAQPVYAAQLAAVGSLGQAAAMQQGAVLAQPGIALPTSLATSSPQVATVSYPTPRAAVPAAQQPKQRVFTGTVTKLHDTFGFVDEDVFFQTSCVKGSQTKVGDRVLVEASYNPNMPFKWNATRIQVLPNQAAVQTSQILTGQVQLQLQPPQLQPPQLQPPQLLGKVPTLAPPINPTNLSQPPPLLGQPTNQGPYQPPPSRLVQPPPNRDNRERFGRERENRERHREVRERRSPPPRRRSRSPRRRSRSPKRSSPRRRATRIVPRYVVQIPKLSLDTKEGNVMCLRSRYPNMYVPSDFFNAKYTWIDAFPMYRTFPLGNDCSFHVMSKEVDVVSENTAVLEPSDADHLFSAKVMLPACPTMEDIYHRSCALADDASELRENFQHPTRLINFLVGLRGKTEPMAIGGPWSPSLDGADPLKNPRVLINTAIRTTKALTGIDLSACTQWYRFAEIRYHRPEESHKGRVVAARVETVVLFLPDVWSCMPTRLDWETMQTTYKKQLQDKIAEEIRQDQQGEEEDKAITDEDGTAKKSDPTHFSQLDPKNMKVTDLRKELEARNISIKGLKSQLIARLTKATKSEQEKEEEEEETKKEEEAAQAAQREAEEPMEADDRDDDRKKKDEDDRKRKEEREKAARERRYTVPDNPTIVVHPSTTAKSGKFDCTVMSLSVLLDYRPEDNKEHSFEVSLFAELFNEMLMRDFGFNIYKSLVQAPERKEEEKEKDKKDDKKDKSSTSEPSTKKRKTDDKSDEKKDDKKDEKDKRDDKKSKKEDDDEDDDDEDDDDDKKDKKKDKKKEKLKFYTKEKDLLLSFVYFDQNHSGYILDKDMEEILHTLGLHLSRAQIRKLVQKVVARDTLNYRKLTDVPKKKDDESSHKDESGSSPDALTDEKLATGNKSFLAQSEPAKECPEASSTEGGATGMVMYNGSLLDIGSVMQRLEKSEKTRGVVEDKLKTMQSELEGLKTNYNSSEQNSQKVASELSELKKKLRDQKKMTEHAEHSSKKYLESLKKSKETLQKVVTDMTAATTKEEIKDEPQENGR